MRWPLAAKVKPQKNKTPGQDRGLRLQGSLLNLSFFVNDMLARHWIVLFHLKLVGHGPLVFVSGVKMARPGRGIHSNLLSHH